MTSYLRFLLYITVPTRSLYVSPLCLSPPSPLFWHSLSLPIFIFSITGSPTPHSEPRSLYFSNVIREARFHALQRPAPSVVSLSDVRAAMSAVQPTAMREMYVNIPKVSFFSGVANEC